MPQCQHVPPSLLVAALAQEVLTLQNRLDRREPEVIDIGGRHSG